MSTSYQKLQELVADFDLERGVLLRMLAEERGIDNDAPTDEWIALLDEVDARKAAYVADRAAVALQA